MSTPRHKQPFQPFLRWFLITWPVYALILGVIWIWLFYVFFIFSVICVTVPLYNKLLNWTKVTPPLSKKQSLLLLAAGTLMFCYSVFYVLYSYEFGEFVNITFLLTYASIVFIPASIAFLFFFRRQIKKNADISAASKLLRALLYFSIFFTVVITAWMLATTTPLLPPSVLLVAASAIEVALLYATIQYNRLLNNLGYFRFWLAVINPNPRLFSGLAIFITIVATLLFWAQGTKAVDELFGSDLQATPRYIAIAGIYIRAALKIIAFAGITFTSTWLWLKSASGKEVKNEAVKTEVAASVKYPKSLIALLIILFLLFLGSITGGFTFNPFSSP